MIRTFIYLPVSTPHPLDHARVGNGYELVFFCCPFEEWGFLFQRASRWSSVRYRCAMERARDDGLLDIPPPSEVVCTIHIWQTCILPGCAMVRITVSNVGFPPPLLKTRDGAWNGTTFPIYCSRLWRATRRRPQCAVALALHSELCSFWDTKSECNWVDFFIHTCGNFFFCNILITELEWIDWKLVYWLHYIQLASF